MLLAALPLSIMAQNRNMPIRPRIKRAFTIDDLIPGGSTYYQSSVAQRTYTTWWGDECVRLDMDHCSLIDKKNPDSEGEQLFSLNAIRPLLRSADIPQSHLYYAEFPYPDQPLVMLKSPSKQALVDWKRHVVVWTQQRDSLAQAEEWSKTSRNLAFVKDHNLYVCDQNGKTSQLTTDGTSDIVYGQSVHRNEFGIEGGLFWSEQGTKLAFYRMDQSMVSAYPQVDLNLDPEQGESRCAKAAPDRYPMAGETSHKVTVGIYDTTNGTTVCLDCGDPTDRYFTNIAWAPDGNTLYLIELDRAQKNGKLDAYDATTGKYLATLFTEHNDKYFEPLHPIQFLPWDSKRFVYQTRRDGYNHIYLYKLDGVKAELERQLTSGSFEVINLLGFNGKEKSVVYASNEANPIGCALYTVDMKGKRKALGGTDGWHTAALSGSGLYVTDSWMMPEGPIALRQDLVNTSDGKRVTFNDAKDPWDSFNVPEIKVGTLKAADGVTDLYGAMYKPYDFDSTKVYPICDYVYPGPQVEANNISWSKGFTRTDRLAQIGMIVITVGNRGGHPNRSKWNHNYGYGNLRDYGLEDQKYAIQQLGARFPFIDLDRVGIHGHSGGGFMSTAAILKYPDFFKVAVSCAGNHDNSIYNRWWSEQHHGILEKINKGDTTFVYHIDTNQELAKNLKGRLMLFHGDIDNNVHPANTIRVVNALIRANKRFDMMILPGQRHGFGDMNEYFFWRMADYYSEWLIGDSERAKVDITQLNND